MIDPFDAGKLLRDMADRIELNASGHFGGAFVIIPPGDGEPMQMIILDPSQDPAQFWGTVLTKCQTTLKLIQDQERGMQGYGR